MTEHEHIVLKAPHNSSLTVQYENIICARAEIKMYCYIYVYIQNFSQTKAIKLSSLAICFDALIHLSAIRLAQNPLLALLPES